MINIQLLQHWCIHHNIKFVHNHNGDNDNKSNKNNNKEHMKNSYILLLIYNTSVEILMEYRNPTLDYALILKC